MAGKKDIVEQALKLVMGAGEKVAPKAAIRYPLAPRSRWWGDANFDQTGGYMTEMTPDEYLSKTRPMKMDDLTRENIDDLKKHIQSGRELDPVAIYASGKEDGRHRAHAAKELGIDKIPVLTWEKTTFEKKEQGGRIAKGPGGWVDDVVKMAGKVISGEGDNVTRLSDVKSARARDALIKQLKSSINQVKSGYFQAGIQALINQKSLDLHKSGMLPLQQGTIVTPPSTWDMPGDWRVSGYWYDEKDPRRFGYRLQNESGQTYDAAASDPRAGLKRDNPYSFGAGFKAYAGPNAAPPKPVASPVEKPAIALKPPEVLDAINKEYEDLFGSEDPFKPKAHGGRIAKGPGGWLDDVVKMAGKVISGEGEDAAKAALRQPNQQAIDIPTHLRPGFKVEASPGADEETRNLVNYLSQRDPNLAFDPQSLAERREDLGTTVPAFHGSPRNIEQFTNRYSTPEGYWGGHHYFTSSPLDASHNYATPTGPDITRRLSREEELAHEGYHPDWVRDWYEEKYGTSEGVDLRSSDLLIEWAKDIARNSLGITNEGAVYPVNLRMKNPVNISGPNQTFWDYNVKYDDAGNVVSEGGKAIDLINETRNVLSDYNFRKETINEIVGELGDEMIGSGGLDAKTYNDIMRKRHIYTYDDNGNMIGSAPIMSEVFQRIGHDSIDMPTDVFASGLGREGMVGVGGDTRHYILFDPKNVRSRFGAFDPFKASSTRISDAHGGAIKGNSQRSMGGNNSISGALNVARGMNGGK